MNLIDVHAHLEHGRFKEDIDKVIERAEKAGVKLIINSGVNKTTNRLALQLSEKYKIIKPSFGVYPIDALAKEVETGEAAEFSRDIENFDLNSELDWIEKNKDKCLAIGECGLDYNWTTGREQEQKENFLKVIELAKKIDKPLIIHSRKAELDAIDILEKTGYKKVVMHCFSGKKSLIKRAADLGYFFSIPPVIARLEHFKLLVSLVDIKQLLTETDSPYLSPVAGERNEPANVAVTIKEIAKIKNLSEEEVARVIWDNSKKLFNF